MTKFDLITALVQAGFERGIDREFSGYQTVTLRKRYGMEQRVNDFGILNEDFWAEVQVTYYDHKCCLVRALYSNGKVKEHAYDKRAFNAIRDTVKYNGFEL